MSQFGVVYVLTNAAMPGMVKIGRTSQDDVSSRITQLYSTGVPVPFDLVYACKVENSEEVERALHTAFSPNRVNPKREFFRIDSEQAIAILKLLHVEDTTDIIASQPTEIDEQSQAAAKSLRLRRPNLNFDEMDIPTGAVLNSTRTNDAVTVTGPKKVKLNDDEMSLTAATRKCLNTDYDLAPGLFWTYQGRTIRDIYEETYGDVD